jgi:hypothetical protein
MFLTLYWEEAIGGKRKVLANVKGKEKWSVSRSGRRRTRAGLWEE